MRTRELEGREGMRKRMTVFAVALVAAAWLLAAPSAVAFEPPTSCTTSGGVWTVTLTSGPSVVSCGSASGSCVKYSYTVQGAADHVAGLMPLALFDVTGTNLTGNQTYATGEGDPVFALGYGDMSRKAFKVNPNATISYYTVWLDGTSFAVGLVPVKIKKGSKGNAVEGACALAGPAEAVIGVEPLATFTEDVEETLGGKCKVKAHTDRLTGLTTVTLLPSSDPACDLQKIEFGDVQISVDGQAAAPLLFSEGFSFIVGTGTCVYKQYYPTRGPIYKVCW